MKAKFTIFPSTKKSDNQPDFKGFITLNGEDLELAIWNRDKGGWSGEVKPKRVQEEATQEPATTEDNPEVPF